MKKVVNILLLGDEGVGKTTLISSYISRHFPQEVPQVMTEVEIPPELCADDSYVSILDSSSRVVDRDVLKQKVLGSDSIILLYDAARSETFDNIESFWLPFIKDTLGNRVIKPVILVKTKTDLITEDITEEKDQEKIRQLMNNFSFVMIFLSCSSAKLQGIEDIFYYGELYVNFPLNVIYDTKANEYSPLCKLALLRIFRASDIDGDNLLSDMELSNLSLKCFDTSLNSEEIIEIKNQISRTASSHIVNNMITFEGFLNLIENSIKTYKFQIPWTILRRFDFDDDLTLSVILTISFLLLVNFHFSGKTN